MYHEMPRTVLMTRHTKVLSSIWVLAAKTFIYRTDGIMEGKSAFILGRDTQTKHPDIRDRMLGMEYTWRRVGIASQGSGNIYCNKM